MSHYRIDECRYVINNLLDVEHYSITRDQAEYLAAYNRGSSFSNPHLRIAYVTTDPPRQQDNHADARGFFVCQQAKRFRQRFIFMIGWQR